MRQQAMRLFIRQHGAATRQQLMELGASRGSVQAWVGSGLSTVGRGVVVHDDFPATFARDAVATSLAFPAGAVSHLAAARMHGIETGVGDPAVEVSVPPACRSRWPLATVRRVTWLPDDDITVVDGVRVMSLARTVVECALVLGFGRSRALIGEAVRRGRSLDEIARCAERLAERGRPGTVKRREVLAPLLADLGGHGSFAEARFRELLQHTGERGWIEQWRPPWARGAAGVVDFADPVARLIVEIDGARWHASPTQQNADRARERDARAHGFTVLRYTLEDVVGRPAEVVDDLRRARHVARVRRLA